MADIWPPHWGERTFVMGIVNITPDSFSGDGIMGCDLDYGALAERLQAEGADIIDVGGESTRPGHHSISTEEELRRVIPAIEGLARHSDVPISVDTTTPEVARRALEAGASVVNDVSGSRDVGIAQAVADVGAGLVIVHRGRSDDLDALVPAVVAELDRQVLAAVAAGVLKDSIVVDPGLGIGKGWLDNFEIIRGLSHLRSLGLPILVGPSRKGMIGRVLGVEPNDRVEGTIALVTMCVALGADAVRVHDVRAMARTARMTDALVRDS